MIINNLILAAICNDIKHAAKYTIDDKNICYYKGEKIGKIKEEHIEKDGEIHHNIYFFPYKPIEKITVNLTICPTGAELKE